jgi:hypothetical protein
MVERSLQVLVIVATVGVSFVATANAALTVVCGRACVAATATTSLYFLGKRGIMEPWIVIYMIIPYE